MIIRRTISAFLIFFILVLNYQFAFANAPAPIKPTLSFAASPDLPTSVDRAIYAVLSQMGYDMAVSEQSASSVADMVSSGEADILVAPLNEVDQKLTNMVMVPEPFLKMSHNVYAKVNSGIKINSWDDFSNKKVGTLPENEYILAHLPKDVNEIVTAPNDVNLMDALINNEVDCIVTTLIEHHQIWLPEDVKLIATLNFSDAYLFMNKRNSSIVPMFSKILRTMNKDGTLKKIISSELIPRAEQKYQVMHITSYTTDSKAVRQFREGFNSTFPLDKFEFQLLSFNEKNYSKDSTRKEFMTNTIRSEYYNNMPEAIVVTDIGALTYVRENYYSLFYPIPVAVFGITGYEDFSMDTFLNFISGWTEECTASETLELGVQLFPKTNTVFVINDGTDSGNAMKKKIMQQLDSTKQNLNIVYNKDVPIQDLIGTVSLLPSTSIIILGKYSIDSNGGHFTETEMQLLLNAARDIPIFGMMSTDIGQGQLGGKYIDLYAEGVKTARFVSDLIADPSLAASPILQGTFVNKWMFDLQVMEKLGIKKSDLPTNSVYINPVQNFFTEHEKESALMIAIIVLGLVGLSVPLMFITTLRRRNHELVEVQKNLFSVEALLSKEIEIQEIKDRLENLIQSAPIGFTKSKGGICIESNQFVVNHFHLSVGDNIRDRNEDVAEIGQIIDEVLQTRISKSTIMRFKMPDNTVKRLFITYVPSNEDDNTVIGWFVDAEQREQQYDELKRAQAELQKLIESLPVPIFVADESLNDIIFANDSMLGFSGINSLNLFKTFGVFDRLTSSGDNVISAYDDSYTLKEKLKKLSDSTGQVNSTWIFNHPTRGAIHATTLMQSIQFQGVPSYLVILKDVETENQNTLRLEEIFESAKQANELKSQFLVKMSHQIRTPMNAIVSLAEIEMYKVHDRETSDVLKKICISSKSLLTIIDDILDFSKIEAEELIINIEEIELEEVLSSALLMASQRVGSKNIEILLKMGKDVPNRILADQTRLWQILKNLLDNSAKYTQNGRILLTVNLTEKVGNTQTLSFSVSDTGYGMTAEQVDKLFVPFEQFHTRQNTGTGTGIGMTITKQLIELMNGNIEVKSTLDVGTDISVSIPFKIPKSARTLKESFANINISKNQVLLVDDEPVTLEIMSELLETLNITPVCASSGEEAIEITRRYANEGKYFNLIVLDYLMGGKNGLETAKQLKTILGENPTKLLMASSYVKQLIMNDILKAGFDDVIEKPFCPTDFIRKLCDAVETPISPRASDITFTGAKVLLVEDNALNQEVAAGILELVGIHPVFASHGAEALEKLEEQEFHLILMDILMPIMDGHQTTVAIRNSDKPYKNIPIIALTANVMQDEVDKCLAEGMNAHVGKPISMERLFMKLAELLPSELQTRKSAPAPIEIVVAKTDKDKMKALMKVENLDTKSGLARFVGKEARYLVALQKFATLYEFVDYDELSKKADEPKNFIHMIKGVSANLGVNSVFDFALKFEEEHTAENYEAVAHAYSSVSKRIREILGEEGR